MHIGKKDEPERWSFRGLMDHIKRIETTMPERSLAFILGAGASVSSGIPSGAKLARRWLEELHQRHPEPGVTLEDWATASGYALDDLGPSYPKIFESRFHGDAGEGYAALEAVMEGKEPGMGYSLLAEILHHSRHRVVVTTNFDNLVAGALANHALQQPLIVGHESLTGFIRAKIRRPLVAKIHRDLFLNPANDQAGVDRLAKGWADALKRLFQDRTPMFIGYGGNDGSLMTFLEELSPDDIPGRPIWCHRKDALPGTRVRQMLAHHKGVLVEISDFDTLMLSLVEILVPAFDKTRVAADLVELGQRRGTTYRKRFEELLAEIERGPVSEAGEAARQTLDRVIEKGGDWWSWELRARSESNPDRRDEIYRQGIEVLPNSSELLGNYAVFLTKVRGDLDGAEALYRHAMEADPKNANNLCNYAIFLETLRTDQEGAEALYRHAMEADPKNANTLYNYALFLKSMRGDPDGAEALYKRAVEADPKHANTLGNYANLLTDVRADHDGAEALYKRAIEADPKHANILCNYAIFLETVRADHDGAEALYKRAIEADPKYANAFGNYGTLLMRTPGRLVEALELLRQSVTLKSNDPDQAVNLSCALILWGDLSEGRQMAYRAWQLQETEPAQSGAEALLYLSVLAILQNQSAQESLGCLKSLLAQGYKRGSWDFTPLFNAVFDRIPASEHGFLEALGAAILDQDKVAELDAFPQWQSLKPLPLDYQLSAEEGALVSA